MADCGPEMLIVTVCKGIGRDGAGWRGMRLGSGGTAKTQFMNWITTRRPTEADGDDDGYVVVLNHPKLAGGGYFHWSIVPAGMAWEHVSTWTPADPDSAPNPVPPAEPWPLPRLFAAPIRRTLMPNGKMILDAIADDGTCWEWHFGSWTQIPPLPQPEAE
jgi:hypothetical protein